MGRLDGGGACVVPERAGRAGPPWRGRLHLFFFENLGAPSPAAARTPHGPSPTPQALANFISFSQRACFFSSGLCTYFLRLVFTQFSAGCGSL